MYLDPLVHPGAFFWCIGPVYKALQSEEDQEFRI